MSVLQNLWHFDDGEYSYFSKLGFLIGLPCLGRYSTGEQGKSHRQLEGCLSIRVLGPLHSSNGPCGFEKVGTF